MDDLWLVLLNLLPQDLGRGELRGMDPAAVDVLGLVLLDLLLQDFDRGGLGRLPVAWPPGWAVGPAAAGLWLVAAQPVEAAGLDAALVEHTSPSRTKV